MTVWADAQGLGERGSMLKEEDEGGVRRRANRRCGRGENGSGGLWKRKEEGRRDMH